MRFLITGILKAICLSNKQVFLETVLRAIKIKSGKYIASEHNYCFNFSWLVVIIDLKHKYHQTKFNHYIYTFLNQFVTLRATYQTHFHFFGPFDPLHETPEISKTTETPKSRPPRPQIIEINIGPAETFSFAQLNNYRFFTRKKFDEKKP